MRIVQDNSGLWCQRKTTQKQDAKILACRTGAIFFFFLRFPGERGQARGEREVQDARRKGYQNTGITWDALRYSNSRSNRNFALLARFAYF